MKFNAVYFAESAGRAQKALSVAGASKKNKALENMALLLEENRGGILESNRLDLKEAEQSGLDRRLVARLVFGDSRIDSRIEALQAIADIPDPVGDVTGLRQMPGGLKVGRVRVPIGVICMIFESRPHVTVNAGALCIKSGNSVILRGGSEVINTNRFLGELWVEALRGAGLPEECVQVVPVTERSAAHELLKLDNLIDLVIPRGGRGLIDAVVESSRIPVIKHVSGVCHVYVDTGFERKRAIDICIDSKTYAPEVCNAAETFLVSEGEAPGFLPELGYAMERHGVEIRGCPSTVEMLPGSTAASEEDWSTEYLDLVVSVKVVPGVGEAVEHINRYGSRHTESIISNNHENIERFLRDTDSGVLLVNASTMYNDGSELGMGAEIGISTDKIHARGPVGAADLTSYKTVVFGSGQCMGGPT